MVSPGCAASIASCRFPPAGTEIVLPPLEGGGGAGGGVGVGVLPPATATDARLTPPVSNSSVITCCPAPSVPGTLIVAHVCHPPVAGTATVVQTLLAALRPRCMVPPP